jgi:hypothetical protein
MRMVTRSSQYSEPDFKTMALMLVKDAPREHAGRAIVKHFVYIFREVKHLLNLNLQNSPTFAKFLSLTCSAPTDESTWLHHVQHATDTLSPIKKFSIYIAILIEC